MSNANKLAVLARKLSFIIKDYNKVAWEQIHSEVLAEIAELGLDPEKLDYNLPEYRRGYVDGLLVLLHDMRELDID